MHFQDLQDIMHASLFTANSSSTVTELHQVTVKANQALRALKPQQHPTNREQGVSYCQAVTGNVQHLSRRLGLEQQLLCQYMVT